MSQQQLLNPPAPPTLHETGCLLLASSGFYIRFHEDGSASLVDGIQDLILAHCQNRIEHGQPFDGKETAEALGMSQKTVGNILSQLRKEGLLPAFDKHSPRKITTTGKKKETIMTVASKPVANKEEPMSLELTANKEPAPEEQCENTRVIISNALTGIFGAISALQRTAFQANDKVVHGFATKLLNGELMDLKANYSKENK